MTDAQNPLLTVKQLAEELTLDPDTIYRWVADGKSPVEPIRLGRAIRFRRVDLDRLLYGQPTADSEAA